MAFGEEWNKLRTDAAAQQNTHTQLNHIDASGSGKSGNADLSVHADDLGAVGHAAYTLYNQVKSDGDHARVNSTNAAVQLTNDDFETGSALTKVVDTWSTQLRTLMEACAQISNHLDYSVAAHQKDDDRIAINMRNAAGDPMTVSKIDKYFN